MKRLPIWPSSSKKYGLASDTFTRANDPFSKTNGFSGNWSLYNNSAVIDTISISTPTQISLTNNQTGNFTW